MLPTIKLTPSSSPASKPASANGKPMPQTADRTRLPHMGMITDAVRITYGRLVNVSTSSHRRSCSYMIDACEGAAFIPIQSPIHDVVRKSLGDVFFFSADEPAALRQASTTLYNRPSQLAEI